MHVVNTAVVVVVTTTAIVITWLGGLGIGRLLGHLGPGVKIGFFLRQGTTQLMTSTPSSLDLATDHVTYQTASSADEAVMVIRALVAAVTETGKAVQVQLTLKARKLGLTEESVVCVEGSCGQVFVCVRDGMRVRKQNKTKSNHVPRHEFFHEFPWLVHGKGPPVRCPRDDVFEALFSRHLEDFVQTPGKGTGHSALGHGAFRGVRGNVVEITIGHRRRGGGGDGAVPVRRSGSSRSRRRSVASVAIHRRLSIVDWPRVRREEKSANANHRASVLLFSKDLSSVVKRRSGRDCEDTPER